MNAYPDSGIGPIPPDWSLLPVGVVCEPPQYGFTATAKPSGNAQFLRITDISDGSLDWNSVPYCECPIDELDHYRLKHGDIVFARIGATTGRSFLIKNPPQSVFASYLIRVRPKSELDPSFLGQYFKSASYWRQIDAQKNANLKKGVSGSLLKTLLVPKPPVAEQRKIAAILSLVQRAIEQQDRLLALTSELKKALLHKLFTEGLRGEAQKQTEIGTVPQSWKVVELREICRFLSGGTPPKARPDYWHGSIPWVSPKDLKKPRLSDVIDHISDEALDEGSSLAPKGSILVVIRGMILAKDVPVTLLERPMAFNQDLKAIIAGPQVLPSFLLYVLQALRPRLSHHVGRSAHGTMTLMSSALEQFPVPLPDCETQLEIASLFQVLERKHEIYHRKRAALQDLFRTLLHQLMTAQIRVNHLDLSEVEKLVNHA